MNAKTRTARRILRQRRAQNHAQARARRAIATGQPQGARTQLLAAGLDDANAKRFSAAFSRGLTADAVSTTTVKLRGRVTKTVQVKLYSEATFTARLATYRPRDKAAAALFTRLALAA